MFREAFRLAMTPRRGPVQINLPRDVLSGNAEFGAFQTPDQYRPYSVPKCGSITAGAGRRHAVGC
eukprot:UN21049